MHICILSKKVELSYVFICLSLALVFWVNFKFLGITTNYTFLESIVLLSVHYPLTLFSRLFVVLLNHYYSMRTFALFSALFNILLIGGGQGNG